MNNFQTQTLQKFGQDKTEKFSIVGQNKIAEQGEIAQLSNKELLRLCQDCGSNIRKLQRQFAVYLIEVNKRGMHREFGFHSIYEFAAKLAGMSHETVDKILRIDQKLEDKPALKNLMVEQGWAKLEVIASVATPETQNMWAEKVQTMTKNTLEEFVRVGKQENLFAVESMSAQQQAIFGVSAGGEINSQENFQKASITIFVRPEIEGKLRLFKFKLEKQQKKALNWENVMEEFLKMAEGIAVTVIREQKTEVSVKKVSEKAMPVESQKRKLTEPTRHIPMETQRKIQQQYNEMCGYPGCNKPAENTHHTKRFSLEVKKWKEMQRQNTDVHDSEAIVPVCKIHHQLAHHGLIKNEEMMPIDAQTGAPNWKLQLRADERAPKFKIDQMVQKFRLNSS